MWILQFMQMAQFLQTFFGETVLARLRWFDLRMPKSTTGCMLLMRNIGHLRWLRWEDLGDQKLTVCSSSIRDCFKGVIPRVSPSSTGFSVVPKVAFYDSSRRLR
mmetsp:Transcript_4381/g.6949  ORF Transcript_4381/g.6949 Transcript_4381/m.6949 type:complete len:104 (+) Transcript_4381:1586-1897(+)